MKEGSDDNYDRTRHKLGNEDIWSPYQWQNAKLLNYLPKCSKSWWPVVRTLEVRLLRPFLPIPRIWALFSDAFSDWLLWKLQLFSLSWHVLVLLPPDTGITAGSLVVNASRNLLGSEPSLERLGHCQPPKSEAS